jgi:hypothetical protein
MIKLFRVQLTMLVFISLLGGVVIYEVLGNLAGLDAIAIAGMIAGLLIGFLSGKNFGMFAIFPSFLAATCVSVVFAVIAFFSLNYGDPLMLVLGQFAMGFCLLSGTVVGCQWGGHFLIREGDLDQLRAVFGNSRRESSSDQQYREEDE